MNIFSGQYYLRFTKYLVDYLGAITLILIFSPICFIAAVAIKLNSPGPVFADVPERVGKDGKKFKMYKFRSMIVNAHQMLREDPKLKDLYNQYKKGSYKLKKDPRITSVGKILRKHSIDEIPQLINVLRGEMSLVGPRAYYPDELDHQSKQYPKTKKLVQCVLSVKPGITGLWQVSGRSEINFDKRIAIDATYVDKLSLIKDIKIIVKTPLVMLTGKGAI